jgi:PIN domain nuclease of toxin-antitoxin system
MLPILLDTCAVIWILEDDPLAREATEAIDLAHASREPLFISPITAWEIGLLAAREHLKLLIAPERWFARALQVPGVRLAEMAPDLLIASSFLPGKPPRDPADRIIAATARELGATLITRDPALVDYGEQGHMRVVKC